MDPVGTTPADRAPYSGFTVYGEWYSTRDELARLVGDRAAALFAYSISDAYGGDTARAFLRAHLESAGDDVDDPQLTEVEALLMQWGRLIATTPHAIDTGVAERVDEAFSEKLRGLLVSFAALTVATNLYNTVGGTPGR